MKPFTRKGLRLLRLAIVTMVAMAMAACGGDDEPEPTPLSPSAGNLKMTFTCSLPKMSPTAINDWSGARDINALFTSSWSKDPEFTCWVRQGGEALYLGKITASLLSDSKKQVRILLDATDKVDSRKPFDVIATDCSWRREGAQFFYRTDLQRGGAFGVYFKAQGGQENSSVTESVAGTVEMLYVVNKTSQPIKFRHKGFDAAEKWFYTHGEVSLDDGHVENTTEGEEAESDVYNVASFDAEHAFYVPSYYVPNGKKIQDAQLIAEIDGKEVRSENRISSDLDIQPDQAYAIFAIWDGEKLTLGDANGQPVIHITADGDNDDFTIVDMGDDDYMTIETTRANMVKVGDVLASGPIAQAPYGFLYRVEEVEEVNTRSSVGDATDRIIQKIKKGIQFLDDILPDTVLTYSVPLDDLVMDYVEDAEGNKITLTKDDDYRWKVIDYTIPILKWTNSGKDENKGSDYGETKCDLKLTSQMDPKNLTFFLNINNAVMTKWGVTYNYRLKFTADLDLAVKYRALNISDATILNYVCKPIVIPLEVPIVITPKYEIKVTAITEGILKTNLTLFEQTNDIDASLFYTPLNTLVPLFTYKPYNKEQHVLGINSTDVSTELGGNIEFSAKPILSFGLYGSNLTPDGLNAGFRIQTNFGAKADFKLGISYQNKNYNSSYEEYEVTDEASAEIGFVASGDIYLKYFNPLRWKNDEVAATPWKDDDLQWNGKTSIFYAAFKDVEAKLTSADYITFTAKKQKPLVPFEEKDFGFCYRIDDENSSDDWHVLSLKDSYKGVWYSNNWLIGGDYDISCNLLTKHLLPNTKYIVRPYVVSLLFSNVAGHDVLIPRGAAIRFKTDSNGQVGNVSIEDIPGSKLSPKKRTNKR